MRLVITTLFLGLNCSLSAQIDSIYAFYNERWIEIRNPQDAFYFRVIKDTADGKYLVHDYYISGNLQFMGWCANINPFVTLDGEATLYYESGAVQQKGMYKTNEPVGVHHYFYENGAPHKILLHNKNGLPRFYQFWSREGDQQLAQGTGTVVESLPEEPNRYYEVVDSTLVGSYIINKAGDSIYTVMENRPEYPGGSDAMIRDLRATLKYPRVAKKHGIEGTVYISFFVAPDGSVVEPQIVLGVVDAVDAEALRAVSTLKKWNPGRHKWNPVFTKHLLPLEFRLKGWSF